MPKEIEKEIRAISLKDAELNDETQEITGYAIVYNSKTDIGPWTEQVSRNALKGVDTSKTYLLYNHNDDNVLASTKSGTLSLTDTDKGLYFRAQLPDTTLGKDTYTLIKRGDLTNMSFGVSVAEDTWNVADEPVVRTINSIGNLYEISIVPYPAYEDTTVSARSKTLLENCIECRNEMCNTEFEDEAKKLLESVK